MRIRDLQGLGVKSEQQLAAVGITTVESLLAADPFEVYARLREVYPRLSLNFIYALIGAQEGVPWQQVARERKTEILLRLEELGMAPGQA